MNYDELEAKYYIALQENKELEKQNNSLVLENRTLEESNVELEMELASKEVRLNSVAGSLSQEIGKNVNLKISLEVYQKKAEDLQKKVTEYQITIDSLSAGSLPTDALLNHPHDFARHSLEAAKDLQLARNYKDIITGKLDRTVHMPMQQLTLSSPSYTTISLPVMDTFGMQQLVSPMDYSMEYHAYAKCGERMVRYATKSLLDLDRKEDFAVVLNQMIDGLKYTIADEYMKNKSHNSFNEVNLPKPVKWKN